MANESVMSECLRQHLSSLVGAVSPKNVFSLAKCTERIRVMHRVENASIENDVSSMLALKSDFDGILLDCSLSDEFAENVLDFMVSNDQIERILLTDKTRGNVLERALKSSTHPSLKAVVLHNYPLSLDQANEISQVLAKYSSILDGSILSLCLGQTPQVAATRLMECTGKVLSQHVKTLCVTPPSINSTMVSYEAFSSFCEGVSQSTSIETLILLDGGSLVAQAQHDKASTLLANAIVSCSSLVDFRMFDTVGQTSETVKKSTADLFRQVTESVRKHKAIRSSNMYFIRFGNLSKDKEHLLKDKELVPSGLYFRRSCWWKQALSLDNLSLNLWPYILAKATQDWKSINGSRSHSSQDILYFFLQEKADVLLQNARKRRRRKRRRFQLSA